MISNQKIYKLIKIMQNTFLIIHSIIKTKKIIQIEKGEQIFTLISL